MLANPSLGNFSLLPCEQLRRRTATVLLECRAFGCRIKAEPGKGSVSVDYVHQEFHVPVTTTAVYRASPGEVAGLRWRDADLGLLTRSNVDAQAETFHCQSMADIVGDQNKFGGLALL